MHHALRLLIILLASRCGRGESLREALQRRSDAFVMYANDFSSEYEPVAYAAVSLHAPVPVLHVMSQAPLSHLQPLQPLALASTLDHHYARPYAPAPAASNTILYARPDNYGGYTYYRKNRNAPKRANKKRARPVLLRIHKYRVIRDR